MLPLWKLEINSEPPRFALILGDVHLPYFDASEAIKIVHCLESVGGHPHPDVSFEREGQSVVFSPGITGLTVTAHQNTPNGDLEPAYFGRTYKKVTAWKIAQTIELRLVKKAA